MTQIMDHHEVLLHNVLMNLEILWEKPEMTDSQRKAINRIMKHWQSLLEGATEQIFHPGQVVFYEGHFPSGVYVVTEGEVEMCQHKARAEVSLGVVPHHRPLGLDLLLLQQPYPFSGVARRESRVFFISKARLMSLEEG